MLRFILAGSSHTVLGLKAEGVAAQLGQARRLWWEQLVNESGKFLQLGLCYFWTTLLASTKQNCPSIYWKFTDFTTSV